MKQKKDYIQFKYHFTHINMKNNNEILETILGTLLCVAMAMLTYVVILITHD